MEIVKYDSYVDSLRSAMTLRLKKRGEKALGRALIASSPIDEAIPKGAGPRPSSMLRQTEADAT
jgi:hypothetical protein